MHIMFRLVALIMMSLLMRSVAAAADADASVAQESSGAGLSRLPPAYPDWSERKVNVSAVPAPPLGPYLSTGLSTSGNRFACCEKAEGKRMQPPSLENMPWPERRRPPQQWMPERGGYNYAPENAANIPAPGQSVRYRYQYQYYGMPQPAQQEYQRPPQVRYR